jgi:hypothetical protein
LLGDVNGSGVVNASDVSQTKAQSGQPLSASISEQTLNASGAVNATDIGMVRAHSGMTSRPDARRRLAGNESARHVNVRGCAAASPLDVAYVFSHEIQQDSSAQNA